ncbi:MAG: heme NO-binding domain-containing protein [Bacteroidetes bacterium]|nr:heme NO-binding domain-containing protein [Bacteroidota bacterium]
MKGLIFTEFLEMVEKRFGIKTVDIIVSQPNIESDSYTSVGSYPHGQMVNLVVNLSKHTGIPVEELLKVYGRYLFGRLAAQYPEMIVGITDPLSFLEKIETHIHVEVKKLYPESRPPALQPQRISEQQIKLTYQSHRGMADVAEGLILGCGDYYQTSLILVRKELPDGTTEFLISCNEC